jgi:hypothetical protein
MLHDIIKQFSKQDRHTLGKRIDDTALEILDMMILANRRSGAARLRVLDKLDRELAREKILLRLTHRAKILKDSPYIALEKILITMGKMLGGWIKYEKQTAREPHGTHAA